MNNETKILTFFDAKQWQMKVQERAQAQHALEEPPVTVEVIQPAFSLQNSEVILFDTNRLKSVRAALASLQEELTTPQPSSSLAA